MHHANIASAPALPVAQGFGTFFEPRAYPDSYTAASCKALQTIRRHAETEEEQIALFRVVQYLRGICPAPIDADHADVSLSSIRSRIGRSPKLIDRWLGRYGRHAAGVTRRCIFENRFCEDPNAMLLVLRHIAAEMP